MKTRIACLAAVTFCWAGTAYALYTVSDTGDWPKSWPAELEPLRKQASTHVGPLAPDRHYAIRFTKREEFEAAWPHIVKLMAKGAPLFLKRAPNFPPFLDGNNKAGVVVHCPPLDERDRPDARGAATPGGNNDRGDATSVELLVDGEIVDLNRIALPRDTQIIDQRFSDPARPAPNR